MEKQIGKYLIKITQDDNDTHDGPREWDNLGTMICFHTRYKLGDTHQYDSRNYISWDEFKKAICKNEDVAIILPLYLYDHSGITMATKPFGCPWDSGQIGFIYTTKAKAREEYSCKIISPKIKQKIIALLNAEVETYDQYLRGDVWHYNIEKDGEDIDSCGGFYGEDYCLSEAEGIVNDLIKKELELSK